MLIDIQKMDKNKLKPTKMAKNKLKLSQNSIQMDKKMNNKSTQSRSVATFKNTSH